MRRRLLAAVALVLAAAGVGHLAVAAYIPAKAALAQVLLHRAWSETLAAAGSADVRPWPWADTHPVARLRVPRLGVDMVVLAGASGSTMAFGPAYLEASAMPGAAGHSVLTGHRDTHFAFLEHVGPGDRLLVTGRDGGERAYRVVDTRVADARRDRIDLETRRDRLTLVTCYPFHALRPGGPLRWVVTADAQPESAERLAAGPGI